MLAKTQQMQGLRESKDQVFPIVRSIESQKIRANGDTAVITELDHAWGAEDQAATRKHRCG